MPQKRSITIDGHRTSFSLEDEFWVEVLRLAKAEGVSIAHLVRRIDRKRGADRNLSSALRLHVLDVLKREAAGN
ncbi:MAG: ribbon-helix-helix domain-containing protein [Pseudomonadota bacterium]